MIKGSVVTTIDPANQTMDELKNSEVKKARAGDMLPALRQSIHQSHCECETRSGITRRCFIQGPAATAALTAIGVWKNPPYALASYGGLQELVFTEFDLELAAVLINFTGKKATVTAVNGLVPTPILRMCEVTPLRVH